MPPRSYKAAGVDIDRADRLVDFIRGLPARGVSQAIGGFSGAVPLDLRGARDPILLTTCDGVGTKLLVAKRLRRYDTVGIDLVAMCVNDLAVCGADPIAFQDYIACGGIDEAILEPVLRGIAAGCELADCPLTGGETAELPDMYEPGDIDLAGFCAGVVDRSALLPRLADIREGQAVLAIASSGIHSNGFSLARKALDPDAEWDELLTPTRIYVRELRALRATGDVLAAAHITGSGLEGNIPRVLPEGLVAELDYNWPVPAVFGRIQSKAGVTDAEMRRVYNLGLGIVLVAGAGGVPRLHRAAESAGFELLEVGRIAARHYGTPGARGRPPRSATPHLEVRTLRPLVIGSGAREHALAWAFSRSARLSDLFIAPGNAGTQELGTNLSDLDPLDFASVVEACKVHKIDAVVVGPEDPLAAGLVDELSAAGIPVVGPPRRAAQLEASKVFSKQFMQRHRIPTAGAVTVTDQGDLEAVIDRLPGKAVLKQDGLAAGKGVLASEDKQALLAFGRQALAKGPLLVEEFLEGYELSVFVAMDGENFALLPTCADFKKAGENDTGPNTGGMGSVCPVPWVESATLNEIESRVVMPTLTGMKEEGLAYKGIIYCGLMLTPKGPRVLEYNVRLGDPETQVLVPLLQSDFGNMVDAIVTGTLLKFPLVVKPMAATGVVIASGGYPGPYRTGVTVDSLPDEQHGLVFHATTRRDSGGKLVTGGGRCFTVVGVDEDAMVATEKAYALAEQVRFDGAWCRPDIGRRLFQE